MRFSFLTPGMLKPRPGGGEGPGNLHAAVAGGGLFGGQRCVGGAEVDGAGGDLGDTRTRADRAVGDFDMPWPAASKPLIQLAISGATSVEPAPVRFAEAAAVERVVMHPTIPVTAMRKPNNLLRIKGIPFGLCIPSLPQAVERPLAARRMASPECTYVSIV